MTIAKGLEVVKCRIAILKVVGVDAPDLPMEFRRLVHTDCALVPGVAPAGLRWGMTE